MSNAWGTSWGAAWGVAWGSGAPPSPLMPNVVGEQLSVATAQLLALGAAIPQAQFTMSTLPIGQVITQSLPAGSPLPPGTVVILQVSSGITAARPCFVVVNSIKTCKIYIQIQPNENYPIQ